MLFQSLINTASTHTSSLSGQQQEHLHRFTGALGSQQDTMREGATSMRSWKEQTTSSLEVTQEQVEQFLTKELRADQPTGRYRGASTLTATLKQNIRPVHL